MVFIINFVLKASWRFRTVILHGLIVLLLIGVTVWDSNLIIKAFIYDNQNTVVLTGNGYNSTSFLESIRFLHYFPDGSTPYSWEKEFGGFKVWDSDHYWKIRSQLKNGTFSLCSINISSPEGRAHATDLIHLISDVDRIYGPNCLLQGKRACDGNWISSKNTDTEYLVGYGFVLENASKLENMENEMFAYNSKTFIYGKPSDATFTMQCLGCGAYFTEFDVKVADAGNRVTSSSSHIILKMNDAPTTRQLRNMNDSFNAGVQILAGRSRMETRFAQDLQTTLLLDVRNLGIYDKTKTTECTDAPDLVFQMPNHPDCDDRGFLKTIVRKCGCVPFSEKTHWREFEESKGVVLPFCSFQHYYNCSEDVGPIKIDECLPSCRLIRNHYTLSIIQGASDDVEQMKLVDLFFTSADHSVVIYEDRYQLTVPQFISQLGGDIGLYTGLSMLGIWQFVVFMFNRYKIYNGRYSRAHPSATRKNLKYFRGFIGELLRSIETFITKLPDDDKKDEGAKKSSTVMIAMAPTESQQRRSSMALDGTAGNKTGKATDQDIYPGEKLMESEISAIKKEIFDMRSKFEEILSLVKCLVDKEKVSSHPLSPGCR